MRVKVLLVAEAPPRSLDRYFYFTDVSEHDSLFRCVVRVLLRTEPTRANKDTLLSKLQDEGVFLIDVSPDPLDGNSLVSHVPSLIRRCKRIAPGRIILIKATVYDVAFTALRDAGLPVVDARIPFPASGRQRDFEDKFDAALDAKPQSLLSPRVSPETQATPRPKGERSAPTLHEEITAILREHGNAWMTTAEIAREVNRRGFYRKRDGSAVTAFQIHGRTRNYSSLFERRGSQVRLRLQT